MMSEENSTPTSSPGSFLSTLGEYRQHVKELLPLAVPTILGGLVEILLPIITALLIGHQSKEYLAAVALGAMICNASAFAVGLGFAAALDTLCSQSFGAKHWTLVGRHTQRMMAMLTVICVPVAILWWNTRIILVTLGIESGVATLAQTYTRMMIPGMWPYYMYDCVRRFLQTQTIAWPVTATVTIVTSLHIPVTSFKIAFGLISVAKLGPLGAAIATVIAYWLLFLLLVASAIGQRAYQRYMGTLASSPLRHLDDTWVSPFSKEIFQEWWPLFKLGFPAAVSLFVEWGSWEFNAAISGHLGNTILATHSVLNQYTNIYYAFPWGIAAASATLGGNALGAGNGLLAKRYAHLSYFFCILAGLVVTILSLIIRRYMGWFFSSDKEVIANTYDLVPILCLYEICDTFKCAGMTYLRSTGRPTITAIGVIASCLVIGYPVSILLGLYTSLALSGVWLGMCLAWFSSGILYYVIIYRTDWNEQVALAAKRQSEAMVHDFGGAAYSHPVEGASEALMDVRLSDSEDDSLEQ